MVFITCLCDRQGLGKCPMIIGILITHGKSILDIVQTPCSRGQHRASYIFGWYNCHLTIILGARFTIDIWRDTDMKRILSLKDFLINGHVATALWKSEISWKSDSWFVCARVMSSHFLIPPPNYNIKAHKRGDFPQIESYGPKYCWSQI